MILREIIIFQKLIQELNCTLTLLAHRRLILKILDNNAYTSPYAKIRQFFLLLFLLPSSLSFPPPPSPRATVSSLRPCAVAFLLKFKSSSSRGRERERRERETGEEYIANVAAIYRTNLWIPQPNLLKTRIKRVIHRREIVISRIFFPEDRKRWWIFGHDVDRCWSREFASFFPLFFLSLFFSPSELTLGSRGKERVKYERNIIGPSAAAFDPIFRPTLWMILFLWVFRWDFYRRF